EPHVPGALSEASQPSAALPLQLSKPLSQLVIAQLPVVQLPLPCAGAHAWLHAPQSLFVRIERSQPLLGSPSQSAQPLLHTRFLQALPPQLADATCAR